MSVVTITHPIPLEMVMRGWSREVVGDASRRCFVGCDRVCWVPCNLRYWEDRNLANCLHGLGPADNNEQALGGGGGHKYIAPASVA